jgi:hypothetical protein
LVGLHGRRHAGHPFAGPRTDHVNNLHWTALIEAIVLGDGGRRHQDTLPPACSRRTSVELFQLLN